MTPAILINSLLFGVAPNPAELGWEIAFEIQIQMPLIESAPINTKGREGGKNV